MLQRTVREYDRIARSDLGSELVRSLQRFDERHAATTGNSIFDWSHLTYFKAKSLVGVVQIPGLQIEILPKTDRTETASGESEQQVRHNLLFMLTMTRKLPLHERDLASQSLRKMPMLEALIRVFAQRLIVELRRGHQHHYVYREENLAFVKGRILMNRQFSENAAQRHRTFVGYDEFVNDTWLNRVFKASCLKFLAISRLASTQQYLREAMLELADVGDSMIEPHHFDLVRFDRNSERFRDLLNFCRLLSEGTTPEPRAGGRTSFALLFPMEVLFEEFIGSVFRKYAERFGFSRSAVHLQARRKSLVLDSNGTRRFLLKPDVLIDGPGASPAVILDTKWKRLLTDDENAKNAVSQSDMYQLFAYSQRYECQNNILLYPRVPNVSQRVYRVDGDAAGHRLKVMLVDLAYDLHKNTDRLIDDLQAAISA